MESTHSMDINFYGNRIKKDFSQAQTFLSQNVKETD